MALMASCAFATSMATPHHVAVAEDLGYQRAWLYDSPALYPDVWMTLLRCAERTSKIGLGPGVLVPSLRHPMVNAAAIATLVDVAGAERVAVGIGSGFTGRLTLGQRSLQWSYVAAYVRALRALLRGEIVSWEGGKCQMMHADGYGAARPIEVPILIGVAGPKGVAVARDVADGVMLIRGNPLTDIGWQTKIHLGTVLDDGEEPASSRVVDAVGPFVAVAYHAMYEAKRPIGQLPDGERWAAGYDEVPADERHLEMHKFHAFGVNASDRAVISPDLVAKFGMAVPASELREQMAALESGGVDEIAFQPSGSDIPGELERFIAALRG